MSAFMVSKRHIDALVNTAYYGPSGVNRRTWHAPYYHGTTLASDLLNELGDMLVKENLSSIHSRYPDTVSNPDATPGPIDAYYLAPYETDRMLKLPTAVQALKLISCYEYQSCEHPEWHTSDAKEFCEALRHSLISCLPGYEDAPWEWSEVAA